MCHNDGDSGEFRRADRHLHVCVLPSNMPLIFPRPLMEHFGLVGDFGKKRLQWGKVWAPERQHSGGGRYLLDLCEDPTSMRRELRKPASCTPPQS